MLKSALVAGGTGLVGSQLVKLLIQSTKFDGVKVLVRKENPTQIEGADVLEVDYERLSEFEQYLKADVIFCCLGTTIKKAGSKEKFRKVDYAYPYELAKLCLKNGDIQFNIITANGANSNSFFFYNRVKGDIEKALEGLNIQNLNIFRPSLLLGKRNEKRITEEVGSIFASVVNPLLVGKLKKHRAIQGLTVARAMLNVSLKNLSGIHYIESNDIQKIGKS